MFKQRICIEYLHYILSAPCIACTLYIVCTALAVSLQTEVGAVWGQCIIIPGYIGQTLQTNQTHTPTTTNQNTSNAKPTILLFSPLHPPIAQDLFNTSCGTMLKVTSPHCPWQNHSNTDCVEVEIWPQHPLTPFSHPTQCYSFLTTIVIIVYFTHYNLRPSIWEEGTTIISSVCACLTHCLFFSLCLDSLTTYQATCLCPAVVVSFHINKGTERNNANNGRAQRIQI